MYSKNLSFLQKNNSKLSDFIKKSTTIFAQKIFILLAFVILSSLIQISLCFTDVKADTTSYHEKISYIGGVISHGRPQDYNAKPNEGYSASGSVSGTFTIPKNCDNIKIALNKQTVYYYAYTSSVTYKISGNGINITSSEDKIYTADELPAGFYTVTVTGSGLSSLWAPNGDTDLGIREVQPAFGISIYNMCDLLDYSVVDIKQPTDASGNYSSGYIDVSDYDYVVCTLANKSGTAISGTLKNPLGGAMPYFILNGTESSGTSFSAASGGTTTATFNTKNTNSVELSGSATISGNNYPTYSIKGLLSKHAVPKFIGIAANGNSCVQNDGNLMSVEYIHHLSTYSGCIDKPLIRDYS